MLNKPLRSQNSNSIYCGIDISKETFNWHCLGQEGQLPNTKAGYIALLRLLKKISNTKTLHVIMESTGGYEKGLRYYLHSKKISLTIANAARVRDYANSRGVAKTDKIDARIIAQFAISFEAEGKPLSPTPEPDPEILILMNLYDGRDQLVRMRASLAQQKEHLLGFSLKQNELTNSFLSLRIEEYEKEMKDHYDLNPNLNKMKKVLEETKGVGFITSAVLLAHLPELGKLTREAIARLAGLAPMNSDSGIKQNTRHIRGGRSVIRRVLYMASTTGIIHNSILKAFYERLTAAGKSHKKAITAVMRKLLIHLNSRMRTFLNHKALSGAVGV